MKNVSRNRFLLCFRPVVDMEVVLESKGVVDRSGIQGFPYIRVENKEGIKETLTRKRTFSRVLRDVMFEAISTKKAHDRKSFSQDSCQSSRRLSVRSHDSSDDKSVNPVSVDTDTDQEVRTNSGLSHSSSPVNSPRSLSGFEKKPEKVKMCCSSLHSGICLLVISLMITILWGRLCAIVFTSIWVYSVPRQHVGFGSEERVIKLPNIESRENHKKVIMEGLLERNHHRRHK
ncbi:hypothetical protein F2P56_001844 [Juglans regia]|uniref:Uncharacterized protein n=2 Tax=Juglans regia TaxID=51240 RepID=A0A833YB90_JUGRE|nr:uncharacterized protein At5g23160-like [Juglans regia]KAF5481171.1 hypothetical protein F2P56_001844 [Juglans regia]